MKWFRHDWIPRKFSAGVTPPSDATARRFPWKVRIMPVSSANKLIIDPLKWTDGLATIEKCSIGAGPDAWYSIR